MKNIKTTIFHRRGIEAKIYTLKSAGWRKITCHLHLKNIPENLIWIIVLLKKFNKKNDTLLIIKEGKWFKGDDPEIDKIEWTNRYRIHST